jgi:hypothetical protein
LFSVVPRRSHDHLYSFLLETKPRPVILEVVLLCFVLLLLLAPSTDLNGLDLIFDAFDQFFEPMEALLVVFVEEENVGAWVLLKLLVDEDSIQEQGNITQFLAVCPVNHVHQGVEPQDLADHLLFREIISHEIAELILLSSDLNFACIVGHGGNSLKRFASVQTNKELSFACTSLPDNPNFTAASFRFTFAEDEENKETSQDRE